MEGIPFFLLLLILDLQLLLTKCMTQAVMCSITDPSQFSYKYHESGDLIIGAIVSQFACIFDDIAFSEHPKTKLFNELV